MKQRHRSMFVFLLAAFAMLAVLVMPAVQAVATPDGITAAWTKANRTGAYRFHGDIVQQTIPVATMKNIGRDSRTQTLQVEGTAESLFNN